MTDHSKNSTLKTLGDIVSAPEFIRPWLDRFYEPPEIEMLIDCGLDSTGKKAYKKNLPLDRMDLDRLLRRRVLDQDEKGDLTPADFHARYDIWALFEGVKDIPDDIRDRLNRWELDQYIHSHEDTVNAIRETGLMDPSVVIPRYLLLDEAFEVLDQVDQVFLWPCNCRSMINACSQPIYTCLRFDNSQGQGYEISREKAKEIVRQANKKGLMQAGERGWGTDDKLRGAIGNCCPDCCFPHLLARETGAEKIWPVSRYTAQWIEKNCSLCGQCAGRCPFQAFVYDRKKKNENGCLEFVRDRCRGCGLCAVTCPENAIKMEKIRG